MFRNLRRNDKQLELEEAKEILRNCSYGIISTIGEDGYPYGIPVNYAIFNDNIYIHSAIEGHKIDNINYNNKVSFTVVGYEKVIPEKFGTEFKSVVVFGEVYEVYEEEKQEALVKIIEKYSKHFYKEGLEYIKQNNSDTKVLRVEIQNITGKGKVY